MFKNGSIYHTGNSLLVEGNINGRLCCITIDTGSGNITIVRPDLVQKGSIDWNSKAEWMSTVTGGEGANSWQREADVGNRRSPDTT